MMLRDLIRRSARSLKSSKGRTVLTALAIAVGTFALTLTLAASNGATAFVNNIIADNFDPAELIVSADDSIFGQGDTTKPREYDPSFGSITSGGGAAIQIKRITDADIEKLQKVEGVESVREDISVNLRYVTREGQKKFVATASQFNPSQKPDLLAGQLAQPFEGKNVILPEGFLEPLGFTSAEAAVGKKITFAIPRAVTPDQLRAQAAQGQLPQSNEQFAAQAEASTVSEEFTVVAVSKKPTTAQPGTELYLFIPGAEAKRINDIATEGTENYRKYNFVYVKVQDGTNEDNLMATQARIKDLGFQAQSVADTQEFLTNIIGVLQGIVAGFGAIAIIASVFGIINTMYISVLQRTREIGLMKALGMRKRDIGRLFRLEAAWIGFLGGAIGSVLAVVLGFALNPWITKQLELGDGNNLLIFKPLEIVGLVVILMIVSIFAGWLPSRKAAKLDPIEALRTE